MTQTELPIPGMEAARAAPVQRPGTAAPAAPAKVTDEMRSIAREVARDFWWRLKDDTTPLGAVNAISGRLKARGVALPRPEVESAMLEAFAWAYARNLIARGSDDVPTVAKALIWVMREHLGCTLGEAQALQIAVDALSSQSPERGELP